MKRQKNPNVIPHGIAVRCGGGAGAIYTAADVYKSTGRDVTRPTTPQDIADGFNYFAKTIRERAGAYACRQADPELARLYYTWHRGVTNCGDIARKRLENCPDLPTLPPLPGDHFFAGMANLADYCTQSAKRLCAVDVNAPAPVRVLTTVDRAADYIMKHAGDNGCKSRTVSKEACDMELQPFINTISPVLKTLGFHVGRGCNAAWYPPRNAAK